MKAIVLGCTGYGGMTLLRILAAHPEVRSVIPVSRSSAGSDVVDADPGLGGALLNKLRETGGRFVSAEEAAQESVDVVLAALPHGASASALQPYLGSVPVIDLSADFRFRDPAVYAQTYGAHPQPDLLPTAVYGLPEWHGGEIARAAVIGAPGCYPTGTLLAILPFVSEGLVTGPIVVNAFSGISGAGRKETVNLLFCERSENTGAYNPGTQHRHVPEIQQEIAAAAGAGAAGHGASSVVPELLFTPHLAPMKQGISTSVYARLSSSLNAEAAREVLSSRYRDAAFTGLSARPQPQTRDVRNSNRCDLGVHVEGDHLMVFSVIDNLVKGAAGQAVQAMNLRFGLPETAGLRIAGEI